MSQVLVVGDLSTSFASQQFEARGVSGTTRDGNATDLATVQLIANARGGIVIEALDVFAQAGGVPAPEPIFFFNIGTVLVLSVGASVAIIQAGGQPTTSSVESGTTTTPITGAGAIQLFLDDGFLRLENTNWFVPSGSALIVQARGVALSEIAPIFQWREIPEAPGPP